jgi:hypothetical protein
VGDWCRLYHWFECATPADAGRVCAGLRNAARYRWLDGERWGLRFGLVEGSRRLIQAETITKWGHDAGFGSFVIAKMPAVRLLQACAPHAFWSRLGSGGALDFRWNYLLALRPRQLRLEQAAQLAGLAAKVHRDESGQLLILKLETPLSLPAVRLQSSSLSCPPDADPVLRIAEALATCTPDVAGQTISVLLGLHTPAHGCVHLARLSFHLDYQGPGLPGWASLDCTGEDNPLSQEATLGPYGNSTYLKRSGPPTRLVLSTKPSGGLTR